MKKLYFAITVALWMMVIVPGYAQSPFKKEIHKTYSANEIQKLVMETKFGNTTIKDNGSKQVTVDIVVEVHEGSERSAQRTLDNIQIEVSKQGNILMVETEIGSINNNGSFNITYNVNIPKDKDLVISSKYGNLFIDDLTGSGVFDVAYGNMQGRNLLTKGALTVGVAYGNAEIENANDVAMELKYGNFELKEEAKKLVFDTKYSKLKLNTFTSLQADTRNDDYKISEASEIVADMAYTNMNIERLAKKLVAETAYGNLKVGYLAPDFDNVVFENKYGDVRLNIDEKACYRVHIEGRYTGVDVPDSDRLNSERDGQTIEIKGIVGKGNPTGDIVAESSYGGIKISTY